MKRNVNDLLKKNYSLSIKKDNNVLYHLENIQTLYLYPLSILDYISYLENKDLIQLKIIEIDHNMNYEEFFNKDYLNELKSVEILLKENYHKEEYEIIKEIVSILKKKKKLISFFITDLLSIDNSFLTLMRDANYIKIMLSKKKDYKDFLKKLEKVNKGKSLLHIKANLELESVDSYQELIEELIKNKVDIFQISKELCPKNKKNIMIDKSIEEKIRFLEKKYSTYNPIKVISVKDLKTLYYDRFELREENSRTCYASMMKPYLYKNRLLPCRVEKVMNNREEWSSSIEKFEEYKELCKKCGKNCDDCASIFENDALDNIKKYHDGVLELEGDNND